MKKFVTLAFLLAFAGIAAAQSPVSWTLETAKGDKATTSFKAKLKAKIDAPWHLYAVDQAAGGPVPTSITVPEGSPFKIAGPITSPKPKTQFDQNFQIPTKYFEDTAEFNVPMSADAGVDVQELALQVKFQVCNDTTCLPPKTVRVTLSGFEDVKRQPLTEPSPAAATKSTQTATNTPPPTDLWSFVWLAVTFGAISLLTPCVFPMIPITVSYFMKHADGNRARTIKLATVYSAGIIATFSLLGMLLALLFGAAGINLFAANPWVNLFIGALFLFFAFNLFGFYEISIPASVLTKLDKFTRAEEGKGSAYIGALLMGLTFTLTSFTCTSPFIGTILVSTAQGDWKMPLLGMLIFSTVFAIPFFILATVPRLLSSLPKSGGWLNSIKVVMGFLEVAAAMKFISNVDLVWGAGFNAAGALNYGKIFTREVVLIIWILIGLAIASYVLGLFRLKHDSPVRKMTVARGVVAIMFLTLCFYLASGVLGRKLGELESFLPPKNPASRFNILTDRNAELQWMTNDLDGALARAKAENRKVFVDFTGYTCTNCRWMEANMFVLPEVKAEMEKYVLVSLYTDGDGDVYERQQKLEQDTFGTVALPFYAVFNADGSAGPTFPGLSRNSREFIDFLQNSQKN